MPHLVRFLMLFAAAILVAMVAMCFGGGVQSPQPIPTITPTPPPAK